MKHTLGDIIQTDCYFCEEGIFAKVIATGPNYVNYECTSCHKVDSSIWTIALDDNTIYP